MTKQKLSAQKSEDVESSTSVSSETRGANRQQRVKDILYASTAKGKLKHGSKTDSCEQEADSAASSFMVGGKTAPFKTSSVKNMDTGISSEINSQGQCLSSEMKSQYEPYFGQSLSDVRIHTGSEAAEAASSIDAKAFTLGSDIFFNQGEYSPGSEQGKAMITHELAHTVQADSANTVRKWSAHEHRAFGDFAGDLLTLFKPTFLKGLSDINGSANSSAAGLDFGDDYSITFQHEYTETDAEGNEETVVRPTQRSLGWATENAGDHSSSAEYLDKNQYGSPMSLATFFSPYIGLAQVNWNHFFPLAEKEYDANHKVAKEYAVAANREIKEGKVSKAEDSMHKALTHEAFALHFLQDTFASGHQYPRAFDKVYEGEDFRSKTYHDIFCELDSGMDMRYDRVPDHKFHGDDTADDTDKVIVGMETYYSIAEIYSTAVGIDKSTVGALETKANPGPNIPKIMKDPVAGPIWYAMETDMEQFTSGDVENETVTSSSGMVTMTQAEIHNAWRGAHADETGRELSTQETLALGENNNPEARRFYETILHNPGFLKGEVDDDIIDYMKDENGRFIVSRITSLNLHYSAIRHILRLLLNNPNDNWDGVCVGEDETAVLAILIGQSDKDFYKVVKDIGMPVFDNSIQGDNWDFFLYLCTKKCPKDDNLGAKKITADKNDDAARKLTKIGSWATIVTNPVSYNCATKENWVGIIKALLSGSCGDEDETAIIWIVDKMIRAGDAYYLASQIDEDEMDSGVDGDEWDTVSSMMNKYW